MISDQLREAITDCPLSLTQIAAAADVNYHTVTRLMRGLNITIGNTEKIAALFSLGLNRNSTTVPTPDELRTKPERI